MDSRLTHLESEIARLQTALSEESARRATAEDVLRAHQDRFAALQAAGIATFEWVPGAPSVWSPELESLYGFAPGEYDGTYETWLARLHPDDREGANAELARALETGTLFASFRTVWPDESVHWLECRGRVRHDDEGRPVRITGVTLDATRLNRSEAALRYSDENFARAFRSSPDAIAISRRSDGRLIDVNDRWIEMFGYDRSTAVGHAPAELGIYVRDEDRQRMWAEVDAHGRVRSFEFDARAKDGNVRRAVMAVERVPLGGEPCFVTIVRDVTEQRRVEAQVEEQRQQLMHLNRVVTLSALSGALAHELQQPLTAILANAQAAERMLARQPLDVDELRQIVRDISRSDKRASDVIVRLKTLMQRRPADMAAVDANHLLEEVMEIARRDLGRRSISVHVHEDPSQPMLLGDSVQVQQVLLNLVLNACDAMADVERDKRHLWLACSTPESGLVQLSVIDNGAGIAQGGMAHLFEPFFTSKEDGLGLGLAISRTIVDAHGGRLWAENNNGGGATFHLALRRVEAAPIDRMYHRDAATTTA